VFRAFLAKILLVPNAASAQHPSLHEDVRDKEALDAASEYESDLEVRRDLLQVPGSKVAAVIDVDNFRNPATL
jgi:hypothetical protein